MNYSEDFERGGEGCSQRGLIRPPITCFFWQYGNISAQNDKPIFRISHFSLGFAIWCQFQPWKWSCLATIQGQIVRGMDCRAFRKRGPGKGPGDVKPAIPAIWKIFQGKSKKFTLEGFFLEFF